MESGNQAAKLYYASASALENVANSKGLFKISNENAAAKFFDLAERYRSKMNKYLNKLNAQGVKTTVSNKGDLDRLSFELRKVIKRRGLGYKVNVKDIDKIISKVNTPLKDLPINYINRGQNFVNAALIYSTAVQQAITDSNRMASLSVTAGTNPFLFG